MIAIVIGVILAVVLVCIANNVRNSKISGSVSYIAILCGIIGFFVGLFYPTKYEDWKLVNETKLVALSNTTEYVAETISDNVIESEDTNCKVPVLLEYKRKSKITIWTFGFFSSETKYVLYVPETKYLFYVP